MAVDSFHAGRPVGAICHGVLVAARGHGSRNRALGAPRPPDDRTDLDPRTQGSGARPGARFWDPDYYRTYDDGPGRPPGWMSVHRR